MSKILFFFSAQQWAILFFAVLILARGEFILNQVGRKTPILIHVGVHLLTLGALAEIIYTILGDTPSWPTVIVNGGVAALMTYERWLRFLFEPPKGNRRATDNH